MNWPDNSGAHGLARDVWAAPPRAHAGGIACFAVSLATLSWLEETVQGHMHEPGVSFDRLHELDLDLLATQGLLGLAACAWFWGAWALGCWRAWTESPALRTAGEELPGLLGAGAGYLLVTSLNFDWAPATGPAWLLAGVAWSALPKRAPLRRLGQRAGCLVRAHARGTVQRNAAQRAVQGCGRRRGGEG